MIFYNRLLKYYKYKSRWNVEDCKDFTFINESNIMINIFFPHIKITENFNQELVLYNKSKIYFLDKNFLKELGYFKMNC